MEVRLPKGEEGLTMLKGGKGYTIADIEELPEGERAELIDGKLFRMDAPTWIHQDILVNLVFEIKKYIRKNTGKCKVMPAPFAVYIKKDKYNYVEPDISVICDEGKKCEKGCQGAPDWIIEIVSSSSKTMDYERKVILYREAGTREYWIVDPAIETVTVYDFGRGASHGTDERASQETEAVQYAFSERIGVGIFKDLWLKLSEMGFS